MKIAFLWWFDKAEEIYDYWRDGLRGALEVIGKQHDVDIYLGEKEPDEEYNFYLLWGDSNCAAIPLIAKRAGKSGIILTTMPDNIENLKLLDIVFCESKPVYEAVRAHGIRAVHTFGTDTNFFTPDESIRKDIEYFYPATFSPWKRQRDIAHLGKKLWCVGTLQPDGQEDLQACLDNNVHVAQGYFKVEHIKHLYDRAQNVIIPAVHGSERTVLEAMSMNIIPEINKNNVKAYSFFEEFRNSTFESPREFVLKHYNAERYARKILGAL